MIERQSSDSFACFLLLKYTQKLRKRYNFEKKCARGTFCLSVDFLLEHPGCPRKFSTKRNKLIYSHDAKKHTDKDNRCSKKKKKIPLCRYCYVRTLHCAGHRVPPLDSKIHPVQATKAGHLLDGSWPAQLPGGITPDINAASLEISSRINLCPLNEAVTRDSGDRGQALMHPQTPIKAVERRYPRNCYGGRDIGRWTWPRGALCLAINKFRDQGEPVFSVRDGRLIPLGSCLIIHGDEVSGLETRSINRGGRGGAARLEHYVDNTHTLAKVL